MELSSSNIRKFLIFSPKKAVLILQEMEIPKEFLIFSQKKAVFIFQDTETPKIFILFQEMEILKNFPSPKNKKQQLKSFLYFRKWNFLIF